MFSSADVPLIVKRIRDQPEMVRKYGHIRTEHNPQGQITNITVYADDGVDEELQVLTCVHEILHPLIHHSLATRQEKHWWQQALKRLFPDSYEEWRVIQAHELVMQAFQQHLVAIYGQANIARMTAAERGRAILEDIHDTVFQKIILQFSDTRVVAHDKSFMTRFDRFRQDILTSA